MYSVKEIFYSIQGEGARSGRPAIFLRFSGCNFWNGKEEDRVNAICNFCDTDFIGTDGTLGGKYTNAKELTNSLLSLWKSEEKPYIVCTGGEPLLQLDQNLIEELHHRNCEIALETNGSLTVPRGVDWICMSPKQKDNLKVKQGHELKFVFPQLNIHPSDFEDLQFEYFFIQPMENENYQENLQKSIEYCLLNPKWRLGLQQHKIIGLR